MEELKEILNSSLRAIGTMALLLLAACSDIGDRDNPLDPGAENYAGLIMSSDSFPVSSSAETPSSASDCIGDDCFVDISSSANGDLFENSSSSSIRNVGNSSSSSKDEPVEISSSSEPPVTSSETLETSSSSEEPLPPSSSSKNEPKSSSSSKDEPVSSSSETPVTSSETPTQSSSSVEPPSSSSKDEPVSSSSVAAWTCGDSTITRGDHEYATIVINEQCWLKENLQYEPSSGTTLCYGGVAANCETYGRLYDYEAANLACPTGWRLPTKTELEDLADYSGADMYDAGAHFKAKSGWIGENGDDLLEFTALPGGKCDEEQTCSKIGTSGYWWTSTEKVKNTSHYALYLNGDGSSFTAANIMDNDQYISVRCVKK